MDKNEWVPGSYTGDVTVEEIDGQDVLKLQGSGHRVGNKVISKAWFNSLGSTLYVKWQAGSDSYAGWGLGIDYAVGHGGFTTHHSWGGSTVISAGIWYYTKITIGIDGNVAFETSTSNYVGREGAVSIRSETKVLTDEQKEACQASQIYFAFVDNYGGVSQYAILGKVEITNSALVEKPISFDSIYDGQASLPESFLPDSGPFCVWEIVQDPEGGGGNVIKGTRQLGHTGQCRLHHNMQNVQGVSFSVKTSLGSNYAGASFYRMPSNLPSWGTTSSSDWNEFFFPVSLSQEGVFWDLRLHQYSNNAPEVIWIKDIKFWQDSSCPCDSQLITAVDLEAASNTLMITEAGSEWSVDLSSLANKYIRSLDFDPSTKLLSVTDAGSTLTANLAPAFDNIDSSNKAFEYDDDTLQLKLTDAGGTLSVNLSKLISRIRSNTAVSVVQAGVLNIGKKKKKPSVYYGAPGASSGVVWMEEGMITGFSAILNKKLTKGWVKFSLLINGKPQGENLRLSPKGGLKKLVKFSSLVSVSGGDVIQVHVAQPKTGVAGGGGASIVLEVQNA